MSFSLADLHTPIVLAPMAGGPTTPELAAAVSDAGGLGFLAAGYKTPEDVSADIAAVRERTQAPFGVNLFARPQQRGDAAQVERYAQTLASEAARHGVELGEPRFDDDHYDAKLALLRRERIAVVSLTFGVPSAAEVAALHEAGVVVWVTVTSAAEAKLAERARPDGLIAQGVEAGGHRAYFDDRTDAHDLTLLALLRILARESALPLIATGGIMDGAGVAAALCAGASAAQLGSAFMLAPEAGTSAAHRSALASAAPTALTRAFTGRLARGIVNRFMVEHEADAPRAYPEVNHLTTTLRAAARAAGDGEAINLWAGEAHTLARPEPAGQLVADFAEQAGEALRSARALVD